MIQTTPCAHDLCNCVLSAEIGSEDYCNDACRDAAENGIETETCPCGHPPCDAP